MERPAMRRMIALMLSLGFLIALGLPTRAQDVAQSRGSAGWVATRETTQLWSGVEAEAVSFGSVPSGLPLQVVGPQQGQRIFVLNPLTQNVAWVDVQAVTPIREPTDEELADRLLAVQAAAAAAAFRPWWAMTHMPATAWSGPEPGADAMGQIPQWRYLQVVRPSEGDRVLTVDPRSDQQAYVDVERIGPVGPPPEVYFAPPPADTRPIGLPGRIVGTAVSYEFPLRENYFSLEDLHHNQPISVEGLVETEDGSSWYRIGERRYVPAASVRIPRPPDRTWSGRWIDADLREPVLVTAYEDDRPVYAALAVKGTSAFQTTPGIHRIWRRVANETMDSATLGIPRNSPNGYYLRDVLFTQYFTYDGAALHYNYWRSNWGYAGSHGCLGMNYDDSKFFWDFATIGTIVYVHN